MLGCWYYLTFLYGKNKCERCEAGTNAFVLTPQRWVEKTNATGIVSKSGKYGGGTFAHKDIAFEFASWIS